jgi:hypothetical protein
MGGMHLHASESKLKIKEEITNLTNGSDYNHLADHVNANRLPVVAVTCCCE